MWRDDILNATHLNECVRVNHSLPTHTSTHSGTKLRLSRRQRSVGMQLHRMFSPHEMHPGVRNINKSLPQVPLVGDNSKCTGHRAPGLEVMHFMV